jgi:hypothetical protein
MLSVAGGRRGGLARWVVLVLLLAGAGPAGATGDATWKIGVMGALSGPKAPYGVAHLQGAGWPSKRSTPVGAWLGGRSN